MKFTTAQVHVKSAAIQNVTIDELSTTYTVPTAKLVKNVKPLSPPLQRQQSFALDETIQDVFEVLSALKKCFCKNNHNN